jgi:hypothetical protein
LIAIEAGSPRMAALIEQAIAARAELAVPAGVVAQAWRGGARQVRIAKLLQLKATSIVALDPKLALRVGARCASIVLDDAEGNRFCIVDLGHEHA